VNNLHSITLYKPTQQTKLRVELVETNASSVTSVSSQSSHAVEQVELVVSSESSCAVRLARHSQNAWARHVERVESSGVESSQVEFGLMPLITGSIY